MKRQSKSRYDSISCYIHPASEIYSDIPCEIDDDLLALLKKEGIDETMSCHMAHLFTRDPLATELIRSGASVGWRPSAPMAGSQWPVVMRSCTLQIQWVIEVVVQAVQVLVSHIVQLRLRLTLTSHCRRFSHLNIRVFGVTQVIFEGHVEVDDLATTEHFESIQSTNWQTVRWKPPPTKAPGAARPAGPGFSQRCDRHELGHVGGARFLACPYKVALSNKNDSSSEMRSFSHTTSRLRFDLNVNRVQFSQ